MKVKVNTDVPCVFPQTFQRVLVDGRPLVVEADDGGKTIEVPDEDLDGHPISSPILVPVTEVKRPRKS